MEIKFWFGVVFFSACFLMFLVIAVWVAREEKISYYGRFGKMEGVMVAFAGMGIAAFGVWFSVAMNGLIQALKAV